MTVSAFTFFSHAQTPVLSSYPAATAAIFLDFDGHTIEGTSWNWNLSAIECQPSGLNANQITEVFNRVAEDFRPFNVNVTTDSTKFLSAPVNRRMRVIVTTTSAWYSNSAGGVAFIGSFTWGDDHPCFIFSALLGYNAKRISEAASHETGHTLGLYHQAQYDAYCNKLTDYHAGQGSGEIGWAPIMGIGYDHNFTLWSNGPTSLGCTDYQSELDVIASVENGFGYRSDDHSDSTVDATPVLFVNKQFNISGVINQNTDRDMFRFNMPDRARFRLDAVPYNVGSGNAGSDLDIQISLYNASNTLLSIYNPESLLNSEADTILNPGLYYLKVEGKGNIYAPSYASLGSYAIKAIAEGGIPFPIRLVKLQALNIRNQFQFRWNVEADEKIKEQTLEVSPGGNDFRPLAEMLAEDRSYAHNSPVAIDNQYRLHVVFEGGAHNYSNIVTFPSTEIIQRPRILGNTVNSGTINVQSDGSYKYDVTDLNGKIVSKGQLLGGINTINLPGIMPGIYVIRFNGNNQQWIDKLLRQ
jgi:hypothetical protein